MTILLSRFAAVGDNTAEARGYAITPTCASNLLGYVPDGDRALGNSKSIDKAFSTSGGCYRQRQESAGRKNS
ncbi:MAG: hypothetical protein R3D26_12245 [Cyanobacteriota/Melainabacteria group bacterium]